MAKTCAERIQEDSCPHTGTPLPLLNLLKVQTSFELDKLSLSILLQAIPASSRGTTTFAPHTPSSAGTPPKYPSGGLAARMSQAAFQAASQAASRLYPGQSRSPHAAQRSPSLGSSPARNSPSRGSPIRYLYTFCEADDKTFLLTAAPLPHFPLSTLSPSLLYAACPHYDKQRSRAVPFVQG